MVAPLLASLGGPPTSRSLGSQPAGAQNLTVAGPVALVDLDPHGPNALEDPTQQLDRHLFDAVVARENGQIVPRLATSWTTPDPNTWEFTLRSDVKFSNGDPLTAA